MFMEHNEICGICNEEIPWQHACYSIQENDGTFTRYHMSCGNKVKKVEPCEDCGKHRLLCNECRE
jgi:hypothetical protein